jgi:IclR family acetate operon transcriptional repressor
MGDLKIASRKPRKGTAVAEFSGKGPKAVELPKDDLKDGRAQYLSRAVAKSLEMLELLQARQTPMALNEVARHVKLSKTSAFRLLCTLQASGYLTQQEAGNYELVPEVRRIVSSRFLIRLIKIATPLMVELGGELRETINLAALFENRIEVIAVEESPEIIRMTNIIGHILPPNASSLGKVITAYLSDERREKMLRSYGLYRFTDFTITDRATLKRELDSSREQGFATDREESVSDGYCFAVPILAPNGEAPAGISVSLPKLRIKNADQEQNFIRALKATAAKIEAELF